jgi:alkylation response protein AidB-like acyl-CoA dehydrogenase
LPLSPTPADAFPGLVPFGDPYWYYAGSENPYYNDSHKAFRAKVRNFVDTEILPFVAGWDEAKEYPRHLHEKAYKAGQCCSALFVVTRLTDYQLTRLTMIRAGIYGSMWPKEYGGTPPDHADAFHDLILIDEISRCGAGGIPLGVFFIMGMALGPVLTVGSQYLKDLVARDVISGKKVHALAITEPYAGSDVAAIQTTARREGDFFIVNGVKKFISAGTHADYFTTAVRTGGAGMSGISLLLIERTRPGVECRKMNMQGWWTSGTALVAFDDVKVPVANLIGKENDGFRPIMYV